MGGGRKETDGYGGDCRERHQRPLACRYHCLAGFMSRQMGEIREEWGAMRTAQRNALKASIVQSYEAAQRDGYISACELETMNRRAESYYALGGNNYIHAIMTHANSDLEVRGEIPR